jgi:hypothetical protein
MDHNTITTAAIIVTTKDIQPTIFAFLSSAFMYRKVLPIPNGGKSVLKINSHKSAPKLIDTGGFFNFLPQNGQKYWSATTGLPQYLQTKGIVIWGSTLSF